MGPAMLEAMMSEFFMGLVFIAIVMVPCVVALTTRMDDAEIK